MVKYSLLDFYFKTMNNPISLNPLNAFYTEGFVVLKQIIPKNLLNKLHAFFDEIINDTEEGLNKVVIINSNNKFVTNIDNLCNKDNLSCLELLGSPFLLEIAKTICGEDFFPIQEFALIKHLGDEQPVFWHQDMVHERTGNCFTVGIYLDDADENEGALRVVPKSHVSSNEICALSKEPYIEVPMKAGDILVHDMMLAHSSGLLTHNKIRRVIYFEFLSAKHVLQEQIYKKDLVDNRTALLQVAIDYYKLQNPTEPHFEWKNNIGMSFESDAKIRSIVEAIYEMPINARASAYCFKELH